MKSLVTIEHRKIISELLKKIKSRACYVQKLEVLPKEAKENYYVIAEYQMLYEHYKFLNCYKTLNASIDEIDFKKMYSDLQIRLKEVINKAVQLEKKQDIHDFLIHYHQLSTKQQSLLQSHELDETSLKKQNYEFYLLYQEIKAKENFLNYYETLFFLYESDLNLNKNLLLVSSDFSFLVTYYQNFFKQVEERLQKLSYNPKLENQIIKNKCMEEIERLSQEIKNIETNPDLPYIWIPTQCITIGNINHYIVSCVIHRTEREVDVRNLPSPLLLKRGKSILKSKKDRMELLEELESGTLKKYYLHRNSRKENELWNNKF